MRIRILWAVFRKEVTDISRDRRALVISVLIPIILFPISFFGMNFNMKKTVRSLESGIPVYMNVTDAVLRSCISSASRVACVESADPESDLRSGRIAAVIDEVRPGVRGESVIRIISDNTSQFSAAAAEMIYGVIVECTDTGLHTAQGGTTVKVARVGLSEEKTGSGILMLQMLIPMLILVFSATAPMAVAADLFAGERERGTLEHLLGLPVTGAELVAGKFLAALCAGITGVISFMSGVSLSYIISPDMFGASGITIRLSAASICWVLVFSILVVVTFTAVEFAISLFSRSAREAQILFIPVVIIAMACGHTVTMIDVKRIPDILRYVPLVNSGLILKEAVTGIFQWSFMTAAALWCALLAFFFLGLCLFMLSREKYIFRT